MGNYDTAFGLTMGMEVEVCLLKVSDYAGSPTCFCMAWVPLSQVFFSSILARIQSETQGPQGLLL
ncbi:hypothetical protein AMTR_s00033p00115840 [Amborella trichopoda]|uniref:Uncharacterized protein n=1 Tax=Amborella trichopoda TaxID=13333 RepID=U5CYJ5_AMBTC|nr:hypothetical protein AMTR_s00033p00115840 [Amborella trichopoda]